MRIRVAQGAYAGETSSNHLDLIDIAEDLQQQGYNLTRVEKGERNSRVPVINLNLRSGPADGTVVELPVRLHLEPYDGQSALNVRIGLIGLREGLNQLYGVRSGGELSIRVFIPNFDGEYLNPEESDDSDAPEKPNERPRDRVMRAIAARRGAPGFRAAQLERFSRSCAVSGCTVVETLEAAHIRAYRFETDNARENGILLRADLHTLFDLDLLGVNPDSYIILVHDTVQELQYRLFHGRTVAAPDGGFDGSALRQRWAIFQSRE